MSGTMRLPGESERDWMRRSYKAQGLDPDLAGRATDGPRFAGESESDWMEGCALHAVPLPRSPKTDDDSDADDR